MGETIPKFTWNHKRSGIAKAIKSKMNNAGGITITDFKRYYRVLVIKNSMVLAQKQTCQSMGIELKTQT